MNGHGCVLVNLFLKTFFFWLGTIFLKVFVDFVTILLLFYGLVLWPRGIWDPSSLTRDQTRSPCNGRQSLNHWATRKIPNKSLFAEINIKCAGVCFWSMSISYAWYFYFPWSISKNVILIVFKIKLTLSWLILLA